MALERAIDHQGPDTRPRLPVLRPVPAQPVTSRQPAPLRASILAVGETPAEASLVQRLREEGHALAVAPSGSEALALAEERRPDLVLLDVPLEGASGFEVCRALRARGDVAIIFVTRASTLPERLLGFDLGADDYVVAPCEQAELDRRIRAVLARRLAGGLASVRLEGPQDVMLRTREHDVHVGEERVSLTPKEFALLRVLLEQRGRVLTSDEISTAIWGYETFGSRNFVEAHVSRLRSKLREAGAPDVVETVRGVGYVIRGGDH